MEAETADIYVREAWIRLVNRGWKCRCICAASRAMRIFCIAAGISPAATIVFDNSPFGLFACPWNRSFACTPQAARSGWGVDTENVMPCGVLARYSRLHSGFCLPQRPGNAPCCCGRF